MRNKLEQYATHATLACLHFNEGLLAHLDALYLANFPVSVHTENVINHQEQVYRV